MARNRLVTVGGSLAILLAWGCGDDGGGPAVTAPSTDTGPDTKVGEDGGVKIDTGKVDELPPPVDEGPGEDTASELPPWFAKPCAGNEQCHDDGWPQDGFCVVVDAQGNKKCTKVCFDDCPAGYGCVGIQTGGDPVSVCMPDVPTSCNECTTDSDCIFENARCIPVGKSGGTPDLRCAMDCASGPAACAEGYECKLVAASDGASSSNVCVPKTNSCICFGKDDKGNDIDGSTKECYATQEGLGSCKGTQTCNGEEGWTTCNAPTPTAEECDGLDNNCDGSFDEGLEPVACENKNDFGACAGTSTCKGKDGYVCDAAEPAAETCDGADNNCDGKIDEGSPDLDLDGKADCVDPDGDGDNIDDKIDNCKGVANPNQEDVDKDGIGDLCDDNIDTDGDGKDDVGDNCPAIANKDQLDTDLDGQGDACDADDDNDLDPDATDCKPLDPTINKFAAEICDLLDNNCNGSTDEGFADTDNDKLCNDVDKDDDNDTVDDDADNCPLIANSDQADADTDGEGDVCDKDDDNDGVLDDSDNCKLIPNADQSNHDSDGFGDACDTDDDNDGILDNSDNCKDVSNPGQTDLDGDGLGNLCDDDKDGDKVTCVSAQDCADCNDLAPTVYPGGKEICDGLDNNCNTQIDEKCPPTSVQIIFTSATVTGKTQSGMNVQMSLGLPGVVGQSKPVNGKGYSVDWGFYYTLP